MRYIGDRYLQQVILSLSGDAYRIIKVLGIIPVDRKYMFHRQIRTVLPLFFTDFVVDLISFMQNFFREDRIDLMGDQSGCHFRTGIILIAQYSLRTQPQRSAVFLDPQGDDHSVIRMHILWYRDHGHPSVQDILIEETLQSSGCRCKRTGHMCLAVTAYIQHPAGIFTDLLRDNGIPGQSVIYILFIDLQGFLRTADKRIACLVKTDHTGDISGLTVCHICLITISADAVFRLQSFHSIGKQGCFLSSGYA